MNKRILKKEAYKLDFTREEIAVRAIEIAQMIVDGSYKNAVSGIGRMKVLSECVIDEYWDEKMNKGECLETYYLKSRMNPEHPDKDTIVN